ncbi:alpha/beta fold hydrolase [Nocardia terpenica]|uniref:alpha/beta fold hydrolase n=1 Tax=Nocardia terpenica TaxID=455432 RepID=UPI0012FDED91|nr:alpha/beta hydrolase [Nocardia terpenica]
MPYAAGRLRNAPRNGDLLISYNPNVEASYFDHDFGKYSLEGRIVRNENAEDPWVLSIHGARADYTKSDYVTLGLRDRGLSILGMNMSGHNRVSPVPLEETSLDNNIAEAEAFFSYLNPSRRRKIIAYSLGGTPALKVLEAHIEEVDRLVLFGPGIYDTRAYSQPFGPPFSSVIRMPYSYRNNDLIPILKRYEGKVLLIVGEYDGLEPVKYGKPAGGAVGEAIIDGRRRYSPIPNEVIELLYNASPSGQCRMITVRGADHAVVSWMRDHPEEAKPLLDEIGDFLKD